MNTLLNSDEVLEFVSTNYSFEDPPRTCDLIRRGFNDTYIVVTGQEKYIFRVYLNGKYYIDSPEAFQFELDMLEYLRTQNVPVSYPIRMNNGDLLGWTPTDFGKRATALFSFAQGEEIIEEPATIEQVIKVGKTIAAFHLAANDFSSKHERYHLNLKYLVDEPLRLLKEDNSEQSQELLASLPPITELVDAVKTLSTDKDEYGIIHGDLHPGNMHFQGNHITFFDFDHCGYGWRAYDLVPFYDAPDEYQTALLKGYESVRPLSKGERDCLPTFIHLRMLWDEGDLLATAALRAKPDS